ncbi:MAG: hypothetical protein MUF42_13315 [Cytophagaceae bacterium]|jgi:hypothetical protein|nr:hypothetical protein [Cytophagaceae bacterium]
MMSLYTRIQKSEPWIFSLLVIVSTYPILFHSYFPSIDGASHLYNAQLSLRLLNEGDTAHFLFDFNNYPVPNWIGNVLLMGLLQVFPYLLAEKVLLLLYLVLFPVSFRYLLTCLGNDRLHSFLIFPFTYSFMLQMGFYNFSLSCIFLFFLLGYYLKNKNAPTLFHCLVLLLLSLGCFFAHIFSTLVFLIFVGIDQLLLLMPLAWEGAKRSAYRLPWGLALSLLPSFLLSSIFLLRLPPPIQISHLSFTELCKNLACIQNICYSELEKQFGYFFAGILVIYLFVRLVSLRKTSLRFQNLLSLPAMPWVLMIAILLCMYLVYPDSDGWSGYYSVRTAYVVFLFFVLLLSFFAINRHVHLLFPALVLVFTFIMWGKKNGYVKRNQALLHDMMQVAPYIEKDSYVLPILCQAPWSFGHSHNLLGPATNAFIIENYEAGTGYFPIRWNPSRPTFTVGAFVLNQYKDVPSGTVDSTRAIDFILVYGSLQDCDNDRAPEKLKSDMAASYALVKQSGGFCLFKLVAHSKEVASFR